MRQRRWAPASAAAWAGALLLLLLDAGGGVTHVRGDSAAAYLSSSPPATVSVSVDRSVTIDGDTSNRETPVRVALTRPPSANVTVTYASQNIHAELSLAGSGALTFTASDWNTPQVFTATMLRPTTGACPDETARTSLIDFSITSGDVAYCHAVDVTATVTHSFNADAQIVVSEPFRMILDERGVASNGLVLNRDEGFTEFTVQLSKQPMANVVIPVMAIDMAVAVTDNCNVVSQLCNPLTFTPDTWSVPQPVTVAAIDNDVANGEWVEVVVDIGPSVSGDPEFSVKNGPEMYLKVVNEDRAGFTRDPLYDATPRPLGAEGTNVSVANQTTAIRLTSEPFGPVTVTPAMNLSGEVVASPSKLIFGPTTWQNAQTFTFAAGGKDTYVDGNVVTAVTYEITLGDARDGVYTAAGARDLVDEYFQVDDADVEDAASMLSLSLSLDACTESNAAAHPPYPSDPLRIPTTIGNGWIAANVTLASVSTSESLAVQLSSSDSSRIQFLTPTDAVDPDTGAQVYEIATTATLTFPPDPVRAGTGRSQSVLARCADDAIYNGGAAAPELNVTLTAAASGYTTVAGGGVAVGSSSKPVAITDDEILNITVTPERDAVYEYGNPSALSVMGSAEDTGLIVDLSNSATPAHAVTITFAITTDDLGTLKLAGADTRSAPTTKAQSLVFSPDTFAMPQTVYVSADDDDNQLPERNVTLTWTVTSRGEVSAGVVNAYGGQTGTVNLTVRQDLCDYFEWAHEQDESVFMFNEGSNRALVYPDALKAKGRLPDDEAELLIDTTLYIDGHLALGGSGQANGQVVISRFDNGTSTDEQFNTVPAAYSFASTDFRFASRFSVIMWMKFTASAYNGSTAANGTDLVGLSCWRRFTNVAEKDFPVKSRLTTSLGANVPEDATFDIIFESLDNNNQALVIGGEEIVVTLSGIRTPFALAPGETTTKTLTQAPSLKWAVVGTADGQYTSGQTVTVSTVANTAIPSTDQTQLTINIVDADAPIDAAVTGTILYEGQGTQIDYNFKFASGAPALPAAVTITPDAASTKEATIAPSELVFNSLSEVKAFTVTSVDNSFAKGEDGREDQTVRFTFAVSSTDAGWDGKNILESAKHAFTHRNDDSAKVEVAVVAGDLAVFRETHGDTIKFGVNLASSPLCNVTVKFVMRDTSGNIVPEADYPLYGFTITPSTSVAFSADIVYSSTNATTGDWQTQQMLTLTTDNDLYYDGNRNLSFGIFDIEDDGACFGAGTSDPSYTKAWGSTLKFDGPFTVQLTGDDETAAFVISEPAGNINECGGATSFSIKLASKPYAPVTVAYSVGAGGAAAGASTNNQTQAYFTVVENEGQHVCPDTYANDGASRCYTGHLVFNETSWNDTQTVDVTGLDDFMDDDVRNITIFRSVSSADLTYAGLALPDVEVVCEDDGDATGVLVSPTLSTLDERYQYVQLSTRLTSQPAGSVYVKVAVAANATLELAVANGGWYDAGNATFTPAAADAPAAPTRWFEVSPAMWDTPVTIRLQSVNDYAVDGDEVVDVTITVESTAAVDNFTGVPATTVQVVNRGKETLYATNLVPSTFHEHQEIRAEVRTFFRAANGATTPVPYLNTRDRNSLRLVTYRYDAGLGGENCELYRGHPTLTETSDFGLDAAHPADGPTLVSVAYATFFAPSGDTPFIACFEHTMPRDPYYIHSARNGLLQTVTTPTKSGNNSWHTPEKAHIHYYLPDATVGQYAILQVLAGNATYDWQFTYPKSSCARGTDAAACREGDLVKIVPSGKPCTYEYWTRGMEYYGSAYVDADGVWAAAADVGVTEGTHGGGAGAFGTQHANPLVDAWTAGGDYGALADATVREVPTPGGYRAAGVAYVYVRLPQTEGGYDVCYSNKHRRKTLAATAGTTPYPIPMWAKLPRCRSRYNCSVSVYPDPPGEEGTTPPAALLRFEVAREPVGWSAIDLTPGTVADLVIDDSNQRQLDNRRHGPWAFNYTGAGTSGTAPTPVFVDSPPGEDPAAGGRDTLNYWAPRGGDTVKLVPAAAFAENITMSPRHNWTSGALGYRYLAYTGSFPGAGCWEKRHEVTNRTSGTGWAEAGLSAAGMDEGSTRPLASMDLRGDPTNTRKNASTEDAGVQPAVFTSVFLPDKGSRWMVCYRRTCNAPDARCRRHSGYRVLPFHKAGRGHTPRRWLHLGDRYPYGGPQVGTAAGVLEPAHPLVPGRYAGEYEDAESPLVLALRWSAPMAHARTWAPVHVHLANASEPRRLDVRPWDFTRAYDRHPWDRVAYTYGSALRVVPEERPCDYESFARDVAAGVAAQNTDGGTVECDNLHGNFDAEWCLGSAANRVDVVNATYYLRMPVSGRRYAVCYRMGGKNWRKLREHNATQDAVAFTGDDALVNGTWRYPEVSYTPFDYGASPARYATAGGGGDGYDYNYTVNGPAEADANYTYDPGFRWSDTRFEWGPYYDAALPVWEDAAEFESGGAYFSDYGPDAGTFGKEQYYLDETSSGGGGGGGIGKDHNTRGRNQWGMAPEDRVYHEYYGWAQEPAEAGAWWAPGAPPAGKYWNERFAPPPPAPVDANTSSDGDGTPDSNPGSYLDAWSADSFDAHTGVADYANATVVEEWRKASLGVTPAPPATPVPGTPTPQAALNNSSNNSNSSSVVDGGGGSLTTPAPTPAPGDASNGAANTSNENSGNSGGPANSSGDANATSPHRGARVLASARSGGGFYPRSSPGTAADVDRLPPPDRMRVRARAAAVHPHGQRAPRERRGASELYGGAKPAAALANEYIGTEYFDIAFYGYSYDDAAYLAGGSGLANETDLPQYTGYGVGFDAAVDPVSPADFQDIVDTSEAEAAALTVLDPHPVSLHVFDERRSGYEALIVVRDPTMRLTSAPRRACTPPRRCSATGDVVRVVPEIYGCDMNPVTWQPTDADMRLGVYSPATAGTAVIDAVRGTRLEGTFYYNASAASDGTPFTRAWLRHTPEAFESVAPETVDFTGREYASAGVVLPVYTARVAGVTPERYHVCFKHAGQSHWHVFNYTISRGPGLRVSPRPGSHVMLAGETKRFTLHAEDAFPEGGAGVEVRAKLVFWRPHWTSEANKACQAGPAGSTQGELAGSSTSTFTIVDNQTLAFDLRVPHLHGPHALCVQVVTPSTAAMARTSWWRPGDATQPSYFVMDNGLRWFVRPGAAPTNLGLSEVHLIRCRPTPFGYCTYADTNEDAFQTGPGEDVVKIVAADAYCETDPHVGVGDPATGIDDLGPADGPTDVASFRVSLPATAADAPASYKVCVKTMVTGRGFYNMDRWFEVQQAANLPDQVVIMNTVTDRPGFTTIPAYVKSWRLGSVPGAGGDPVTIAPKTSVLSGVVDGAVALAGALSHLGNTAYGFHFQTYGAYADPVLVGGVNEFKLVVAKQPTKAVDQADPLWGDVGAWNDLGTDCADPAYSTATNEAGNACEELHANANLTVGNASLAGSMGAGGAGGPCSYAARPLGNSSEFHAVFHVPLDIGGYHVCYRHSAAAAWLSVPPEAANFTARDDPYLYTHPTFLGLHQTGLSEEVDADTAGVPPVDIVDLRTKAVPGGGLVSVASWCNSSVDDASTGAGSGCKEPDMLAVVNASQNCPAPGAGVWYPLAAYAEGVVRVDQFEDAEAAFDPAYPAPTGQYRVCVMKSTGRAAVAARNHVVVQPSVVYQLNNFGTAATGGGSGYFREASTLGAEKLTVHTAHVDPLSPMRFVELDPARTEPLQAISDANVTDTNGELSRSVLVETGDAIAFDVRVAAADGSTVPYGTWAVAIHACEPAGNNWINARCYRSRPVGEAVLFEVDNIANGACTGAPARMYGWEPRGLAQFTVAGRAVFNLQYKSACPEGVFGCGVRFYATPPRGSVADASAGGDLDDETAPPSELWSLPQWVNVRRRPPAGIAIDGRVAVSRYRGDARCRAAVRGDVVECYKRTCDSGVACEIQLQALTNGAPQDAPKGTLRVTYSTYDYVNYTTPDASSPLDVVAVPGDVDALFGRSFGRDPIQPDAAWGLSGEGMIRITPELDTSLLSGTAYVVVHYGEAMWTRFAVEIVRRQPAAVHVADVVARDISERIADDARVDREPVPHPDCGAGGAAQPAQIKMYLEALVPYEVQFAAFDAAGIPLTRSLGVLSEWTLSTSLENNREGQSGTLNRIIPVQKNAADNELTTDAFLTPIANRPFAAADTSLALAFRVYVVDNACSRFNNIDATARGCKLNFILTRGAARLVAPVFAPVRVAATTLRVSLVSETVDAGTAGTIYHAPLVDVIPGSPAPEGAAFIRDEFHFAEVFAILDSGSSRDGLVTDHGFRLLEDITQPTAPVDLTSIPWVPCGEGNAACRVHTYPFSVYGADGWGARFRLRGNLPCYACGFQFYSTWGAASEGVLDVTFADVDADGITLWCESKKVEIHAAVGAVGPKTNTFTIRVEARRRVDGAAAGYASAVWPEWWVMTDLNHTAAFRRIAFPEDALPGTVNDGVPDEALGTGTPDGGSIDAYPNAATSTSPAPLPLLQQEDTVGNVITGRMSGAAVTFKDLFFHDNTFARSKAVPFAWALADGGETYGLKFHAHGTRYTPEGRTPRVLDCESQITVEQVRPQELSAVTEDDADIVVTPQIDLVEVRPSNKKCSPKDDASGGVECIYWATDTQFASDGMTFTVEFTNIVTRVDNVTGVRTTSVEPATVARNITLLPTSGLSSPLNDVPIWVTNPVMASDTTRTMTLDSSHHTSRQLDFVRGAYYTYGNLSVVASRKRTSTGNPRSSITLEYAPLQAQSPARRVAFQLCEATYAYVSGKDAPNRELCADVLLTIVPEAATVKLALFEEPASSVVSAGYGEPCRGTLINDVLAIPYFEQSGVSMRLYAYLWPLTYSITTVGNVVKQVLTRGEGHPAGETLYQNNTINTWAERTAAQERPTVANRGQLEARFSFYGVDELDPALSLMVKATSTADDSIDAQVIAQSQLRWQRPMDETIASWSVSDAVQYDAECAQKRWLQTYGPAAGAGSGDGAVDLSVNYRQFARGAGQGWSYLDPVYAGIAFPIETVVRNTDGGRAHSFTDGTVVKVDKRGWRGGCNDGGKLTLFELAPSPLDAPKVMIPGDPQGAGWLHRPGSAVTVQRGVATAWAMFEGECEVCTLELSLCYPGATADTCFDGIRGATPSDIAPIYADRKKVTKPFRVLRHRVDAMIVKRQVLPVLERVQHTVTAGYSELRGVPEAVPAPYDITRLKVRTGAVIEVDVDTVQSFAGRANAWTMVEPGDRERWKRDIFVSSEYLGTPSAQREALARRPSYANGGFLLDTRVAGGYPCGGLSFSDMRAASSNERVFIAPDGGLRFVFVRPCAACSVSLHFKLTSPDGAVASTGRIVLLDTDGGVVGAGMTSALATRAVFEVVTCGGQWILVGPVRKVARKRVPFAIAARWVDSLGFPDTQRDALGAARPREGVLEPDQPPPPARVERGGSNGNGEGGMLEYLSPAHRPAGAGRVVFATAAGAVVTVLRYSRACYRCSIHVGDRAASMAVLTEATRIIASPHSELDSIRYDVDEATWTFHVYYADEHGDRAYGVGNNKYIALAEATSTTNTPRRLTVTPSDPRMDLQFTPNTPAVENGVPNIVSGSGFWPYHKAMPQPGIVQVTATAPYVDVAVRFGMEGAGTALPTVTAGGRLPPTIGISVTPSNLTLEWNDTSRVLSAFAVGATPSGASVVRSAWNSRSVDDHARVASWSCPVRVCTYDAGGQVPQPFVNGRAELKLEAFTFDVNADECTCEFTVRGGGGLADAWEATLALKVTRQVPVTPAPPAAGSDMDPGATFRWRWLPTDSSGPLDGGVIHTMYNRTVVLTLQVLDEQGAVLPVPADEQRAFKSFIEFDASAVPVTPSTGLPCFTCYPSTSRENACDVEVRADAATGFTVTLAVWFPTNGDGSEKTSCTVAPEAFPSLNQWEYLLSIAPWNAVAGLEIPLPPYITAHLTAPAKVELVSDLENLPNAFGRTWAGQRAVICGIGTTLRFTIFDHDNEVLAHERFLRLRVTADRFGIMQVVRAMDGHFTVHLDAPAATRDAACEYNYTVGAEAGAGVTCEHDPLRVTVMLYAESATTRAMDIFPVHYADRFDKTEFTFSLYFLRAVSRVVAFAQLGQPCEGGACVVVPDPPPAADHGRGILAREVAQLRNRGFVPILRRGSADASAMPAGDGGVLSAFIAAGATRAAASPYPGLAELSHAGRDGPVGPHPAGWTKGKPIPAIVVIKVDAQYESVTHPEDLFATAPVAFNPTGVPCRAVDNAFLATVKERDEAICSRRYRLDQQQLCGAADIADLAGCDPAASSGWTVGASLLTPSGFVLRDAAYGAGGIAGVDTAAIAGAGPTSFRLALEPGVDAPRFAFPNLFADANANIFEIDFQAAASLRPHGDDLASADCDTSPDSGMTSCVLNTFVEPGEAFAFDAYVADAFGHILASDFDTKVVASATCATDLTGSIMMYTAADGTVEYVARPTFPAAAGVIEVRNVSFHDVCEEMVLTLTCTANVLGCSKKALVLSFPVQFLGEGNRTGVPLPEVDITVSCLNMGSAERDVAAARQSRILDMLTNRRAFESGIDAVMAGADRVGQVAQGTALDWACMIAAAGGCMSDFDKDPAAGKCVDMSLTLPPANASGAPAAVGRGADALQTLLDPDAKDVQTEFRITLAAPVADAENVIFSAIADDLGKDTTLSVLKRSSTMFRNANATTMLVRYPTTPAPPTQLPVTMAPGVATASPSGTATAAPIPPTPTTTPSTTLAPTLTFPPSMQTWTPGFASGGRAAPQWCIVVAVVSAGLLAAVGL